jgi:hypothetical protein
LAASVFIDEEKRELMMKKTFKTALAAVCLSAAIHPGISAPAQRYELANAAFQLTVQTEGDALQAGLLMRQAGLRAWVISPPMWMSGTEAPRPAR